jgi:hypothetical protein
VFYKRNVANGDSRSYVRVYWSSDLYVNECKNDRTEN